MKTYKVTVDSDHTICWYNEVDLLDREDGPAVENANGKKWYINGKRHREDGPAIEYANGTKYWYLDDKELTEKEFNLRMNPTSCDGKQVVIDGKIYVLQEVKKY
jgi:hypothetical protein